MDFFHLHVEVANKSIYDSSIIGIPVERRCFFIFELQFFGCRGSTPICGPHVLRYGGNTTCIALYTQEQLLLIDGGTGLIGAQAALFGTGRYHRADILISHIHWDHVQGFPFFGPLFSPGNTFSFYSERRDKQGFDQQLARLMSPPMFPISPAAFNAQVSYHDIVCGEAFMLGHIRVLPFRLSHPNTCTGFRFEYQGKSVCIAADYEHGVEDLFEMANGVDVLIYDAQYTESEYLVKAGWGHSTWQEGCALAKRCGAKRLYLTHHDPARTDDALDTLNDQAHAAFQNAYFAYEGLRISV